MTCSTSRFEVPGLTSLGEALFLDEASAVAVWGPSGLSINENAGSMAEVFFDGLTSGATERLGTLIHDAYGAVSTFEYGPDTASVYHLFGDPALRLVPKTDEPGTGGGPGTGGTGGDAMLEGGGGCGCTVADKRGEARGLALAALFGLALVYRRRARRH